jgi:protein SCO1/2
VLALVLAAIGGAGAWHRMTAARTPALEGAILTPPVTAYDFTLPDADGRQVSLSSFKGKVVVLTFLYAHCPDVCPLIADQFHRIREKLGDTARHAVFVAVSVDPAGDTPAAIKNFLRAHRVEGQLTYLRGTRAQLQPVWARYFVGSDAGRSKTGAPPAARSTPPDQIGHTSIVYVIDQEGRIRLFLPANFDSKDLETDVRALVVRGSR